MDKGLLLKAKECKSAEEIVALFKENGEEITVEEAADIFAKLNENGELSDEELDNVLGGDCAFTKCKNCGSRKIVVEPRQEEYTHFIKNAVVCKNCYAFRCWYDPNKSVI